MGKISSDKREGRSRMNLSELVSLIEEVQNGYNGWDMAKAKKMLAELWYIILGFKDRDESRTPNPEPNYAVFELELMQKHKELRYYIVELIANPPQADYYEGLSLKECWKDFAFVSQPEGCGTPGEKLSEKAKTAMIEKMLPKVEEALAQNKEDENAIRVLWGINGRYNHSTDMYKRIEKIALQYDPQKRHRFKTPYAFY